MGSFKWVGNRSMPETSLKGVQATGISIVSDTRIDQQASGP